MCTYESNISLLSSKVLQAKSTFEALGWEDPLEEEMATHSSTPAWKIPWTEKPVYGVTKSQTRVSNFTFFTFQRLREFSVTK